MATSTLTRSRSPVSTQISPERSDRNTPTSTKASCRASDLHPCRHLFVPDAWDQRCAVSTDGWVVGDSADRRLSRHSPFGMSLERMARSSASKSIGTSRNRLINCVIDTNDADVAETTSNPHMAVGSVSTGALHSEGVDTLRSAEPRHAHVTNRPDSLPKGPYSRRCESESPQSYHRL